jgi:ZIP family zinc transporter
MTGGEGFAKVMPAAFGFPWCLIYFGIDKVLPHLHINFKMRRDQITMATNHLVGFGNYITFRRIGCWSSFGGVAAGIPEASIAGAVTLARSWNSNFPEGMLREEWE